MNEGAEGKVSTSELSPDETLPQQRKLRLKDIWREDIGLSNDEICARLRLPKIDVMIQQGVAASQAQDDDLTADYFRAVTSDATLLRQTDSHYGTGLARYRLAMRYETGDGVPVSFDKAMCWYLLAARLGLPQAALRLGDALAENNEHRALYWYNTAFEGHKKFEEKASLREDHRDDLHIAAAMAGLKLAASKTDAQEEFGLLKSAIALYERTDAPANKLILAAYSRLVKLDDAKPGVVVVNSISPFEKSQQAEFKRFQRLLEKVPLAGIAEPQSIRAALDAEFPWMQGITHTLMRQIEVPAMLGRFVFKLRPTLLVGGVGVGKTRYCQRLAQLVGVPFCSIAVGGQSDNRTLQGTSRGWGTGQASLVIQVIADSGVANPLFLLDELEKTSSSRHNGRVWDTLLLLTEPSTATSFFDDYLQGQCDVSHVSWIATANEVGELPAPLLSRFQVFEVPVPARGHYPAIVRGVLRDIAARHGIRREMLPALDEAAWRWLEQYYTNPRTLKRAVESLVEYLILNELRSKGGLHPLQ